MNLTFLFVPDWKAQKVLALLLRPGRCGHQKAAVLCRGDCAQTGGHGTTESDMMKTHVFMLIRGGFSDMFHVFWSQDTGKLRIGTYTGDLAHGTVYSGGNIHSFTEERQFFYYQ